jgi:hypothetical protein
MALYSRRQKTLHIQRCDRSYMVKQIRESKRDEVWNEDHGLVFGRFQIQTSAQRRDILSQGFHYFPQSLQENAGIVSPISPATFHFTSPSIHYSPVIQLFEAIENERSELSGASLCKQ